jgi:hypothetical protein
MSGTEVTGGYNKIGALVRTVMGWSYASTRHNKVIVFDHSETCFDSGTDMNEIISLSKLHD